MAEVETVLAKQKKIGDTIQRIQNNFNTDGEERKTITYIDKKLQKLEENWEQFDENHEELETMDKVDTNRAYFTKDYYKKIQQIYTYWEDICSAHFTIASSGITLEDDVYNKPAAYKDLEYKYNTIAIKLSEMIAKNHETPSATINLDNEQNSQVQQKIKLKPVEIPTFNGNYQQWRSFRDLFYELIYKNNNLGDAVKLQYLKTHLVGEAAQLIRHLTITNENYATAWMILNDRYDNKRLLLSTPIQTILSQPTLSYESAIGLRKLHDTTKECLHAINNLNINTENWGPMIIHIILQKLDKETRKVYEETLKNPKEMQSLSEFFKFLETRFHALEASGDFKRKEQTTSKFKNSSGQTFKTFHTTIETQCPLCKLNHRLYICNKFQTQNTAQRK